MKHKENAHKCVNSLKVVLRLGSSKSVSAAPIPTVVCTTQKWPKSEYLPNMTFVRRLQLQLFLGADGRSEWSMQGLAGVDEMKEQLLYAGLGCGTKYLSLCAWSGSRGTSDCWCTGTMAAGHIKRRTRGMWRRSGITSMEPKCSGDNVFA